MTRITAFSLVLMLVTGCGETDTASPDDPAWQMGYVVAQVDFKSGKISKDSDWRSECQRLRLEAFGGRKTSFHENFNFNEGCRAAIKGQEPPDELKSLVPKS